jgi:hypothetical protein
MATEDVVAGEDTTAERVVLCIVSKLQGRVSSGWWRW